jgi:anti-sigma factor RsiW
MSTKRWAILASVFFIIALVEFAIIMSMDTPVPEAKIIKIEQPAKSSETAPTSKVLDVGVPGRITSDFQTTPIEETGGEAAATGKYGAWKSLKVGMSKDQVVSLLGKPRLVKRGISEIWRYSYTKEHFGDVIFYKNKIITWLPPTIELEEVK